MPKYLFFYLLIILSVPLSASHIIGGDITLKHIKGTDYELKMNLFFDLVYGSTSALEEQAAIVFFDKITNIPFQSFLLPITGFVDINPDSGICQYVNIRSRVYTYSSIITLDPYNFSSGPGGFYMAWQGCCRNQSIINVSVAISTSTTFCSEFPSIAKYPNSSPQFKTPTKNGYACAKSAYTYDFGATDADGDSLSYEIEVPYRGYYEFSFPNDVIVAAKSGPYKEVTLSPGYTLQNLIPGNPALNINRNTGLIGFTAKEPGVYEFTVKCNEYRNGKYIGYVRRDYQLTVMSCGQNIHPKISIKDPYNGTLKKSGDTLSIDFNEGACFETLIRDSLPGQSISLKVSGLNFSDHIITSAVNYHTKQIVDTMHTMICIAPCPAKEDVILKTQMVVKNENTCTLPVYDTAYVYLKNTKKTPDKGIFKITNLATGKKYNMGDTIKTNLKINQACMNVVFIDNLFQKEVTATISAINFSNDISYSSPSYNHYSILLKDTVSLKFCFNSCYEAPNKILKIRVIVKSDNNCAKLKYDTAYFYFEDTTKIITLQKPKLKFIDPETNTKTSIINTITINTRQPWCFYLLATGLSNGTTIAVLTLIGKNFSGIPVISPRIYYASDLSDSKIFKICISECPMTKDSILNLDIILKSNTYCGSFRVDTFSIHIKNTELPVTPSISINPSKDNFSVTIGTMLNFVVSATSGNLHTIHLKSDGNRTGTKFIPVSGIEIISSAFHFQSTCLNLLPNPYKIVFIATDSSCLEILTDSLAINISIKDSLVLAKPLPNIITPNNDFVNDYLDISEFPPDNCLGTFSSIEIYNRWGNAIYAENRKDFRWNAADIPDGIYFYVVKYTSTEYKSWLMVQR